ncbi:MAG: hypothetical protein HZB39_05145 [Planctomycetes bacterium]|nr:hypothetical protein [Planctomycetota bacterium]
MPPVSHHLVLGVVLLTSACTLHSGSRRSVYRGAIAIPANEIVAVAVNNGAGIVRFAASKRDAIDVDVEVFLDEARPQTDAAKSVDAHLVVTRDGDRLVLNDSHAGDHDAGDWELRITVHVPGSRTIQVDQAAGSVELALDRCRDVRVVNAAGSIQADVGFVEGALDLRAHSGEVVAAVRESIAGDASVETQTGRASLALPKGAPGAFDVSVDVGGLVVDPRFGLDVERSLTGARATGRMGDGGPSYRVRTLTGEAVLK